MNRFTILCFLFAGLLLGCKTPEARKPIEVKSGSFINASVERNIKLNNKEQEMIQNMIDKHPDIEYIASESGFWYYYDHKIEQDTITPRFGDIVNFDYNVKDFNGAVIYSDNDIKARDYTMDKEELFTGLREGLKLMKPGETVTFLFPSQKAYGYYGDTKKIGTNIPLICKVTLNTITKNKN